jgi:hypothetical protein
MYIEAIPNRGSPPAILLRESFRENGQVKKRTLANLSDWPSALVEGFRTLLKGGVAVAADGIRICRTATPPPCWARSGRSVWTGGSASRATSAWRRWSR